MTEPKNLTIEDYTYSLPSDRIAYHPLKKRDSSKLLVYEKGAFTDEQFFNLPHHFSKGDLLVLNNTKVIEARLVFRKTTGAIIEIFCLEPFQQSMELALQQIGSASWKCLIGGASKWKPGLILEKEIFIDGSTVLLKAGYKEKSEDGFIIEFTWEPQLFSFVQILHAAGAIPLPPYIKRNAEDIDAERYQTIFGKQEGSVAAPTAALHFTEKLFEELARKGINTDFVTLNVGAGTFKPVKTSSVAAHQMHGEDFTITKNVLRNILSAERVIAVGTTSLRTLESTYWLGVKLLNGLITDSWMLEQWEAYEMEAAVGYKESFEAIIHWMDERKIQELHCRTSLLIAPGYEFKIPSALITNFHQPQSTLLLLVAAFIGDDWKKVYRHALEKDYRFLSYGDSSLLWRSKSKLNTIANQKI